MKEKTQMTAITSSGLFKSKNCPTLKKEEDWSKKIGIKKSKKFARLLDNGFRHLKHLRHTKMKVDDGVCCVSSCVCVRCSLRDRFLIVLSRIEIETTNAKQTNDFRP